MKIGERFVKDSLGDKLEYEVVGFDGSNRPIANFVRVITEDIITEEKIVEAKAVVEKKPTATKVPTKKTVAKKK